MRRVAGIAGVVLLGAIDLLFANLAKASLTYVTVYQALLALGWILTKEESKLSRSLSPVVITSFLIFHLFGIAGTASVYKALAPVKSRLVKILLFNKSEGRDPLQYLLRKTVIVIMIFSLFTSFFVWGYLLYFKWSLRDLVSV